MTRAARSLLCALLAAGAARALLAQEPAWGTGSWDPSTLGNHRAVVLVGMGADAVRVRIPWRRRDASPQDRNLVVVAAMTGSRVANVARIEIGREAGEIAFEPSGGPGEYHVYYLPHVTAGSKNYPRVSYPAPESTAAPAWLERFGLAPPSLASGAWRRLPEARVAAIQSVDAFNSFFPMEVIATAQETKALLARHPGAPYLLFPEDRTRSIRMTDDLPRRWADGGANGPITGEAKRGEFYAFQVGVYALTALDGVDVDAADLVLEGGAARIPAAAVSSFATRGVDPEGRAFRRSLSLAAGKVQALWLGVQVPQSAPPGTYAGSLTVSAKAAASTTLPLRLRVTPETIAAAGDDEPWRLSRLRWLDSRLAQDDSLVRPYTAVQVKGLSLGILGREVELSASGLPKSLRSRFAPEMTRMADAPREILARPLTLVIESAPGRALPWTGGPPRITKQAEGAVAWEAKNAAGPIDVTVKGRLEFDGCLEYEVALRARAAASVADVRLELPVARDVARYMMGLGRKGGLRPATYEWSWKPENNQDAVWIGDVNAGAQLTLKHDRYVRPLNTNFYTLKPLVMPASWANGGKGYCRFAEETGAFVARCGSGPRALLAGEVQRYDFRLLLTPFRTLDTAQQWATRFFHAYKPLAEIKAAGANVVNVHHATEVNPFINYPFLRPEAMKAYVDEAHRQGMKVKIYYTVRELTNRAPELHMLRSLGDEVLSPGPGGGFSWLQEHLGGNYIAGWLVPELKDAAVINSGVSRWHNFYVEGLAWLARNVGIDGLYIDDVAFDRTTMKRVRRVLDAARPGALIDLHSANQYNPRDGHASSANLYLEHFPYLDRLWFGEYFDYDSPPDYWLVEMSGIPFGLMSEMLEKGGNPWRGMVYGMTTRLPWAGDPRPLWRFWDAYGMADTRMLGYWAPTAPVKTGREDVLATTYAGNGRAIVAVASWAKDPVDVALAIDWKALGLDPARARFAAPAIEAFQAAASFAPGAPIPVAPGKGWLLVIE
jgi:hypothetical protein